MQNQPKFNILCLQGGEFRDYYTLYLLKKFEQSEQFKNAKSRFDLIVGTGSAQIIATLLKYRCSIDEIIQFYDENLDKIYNRYYSQDFQILMSFPAFFGFGVCVFPFIYSGLDFGETIPRRRILRTTAIKSVKIALILSCAMHLLNYYFNGFSKYNTQKLNQLTFPRYLSQTGKFEIQEIARELSSSRPFYNIFCDFFKGRFPLIKQYGKFIDCRVQNPENIAFENPKTSNKELIFLTIKQIPKKRIIDKIKFEIAKMFSTKQPKLQEKNIMRLNFKQNHFKLNRSNYCRFGYSGSPNTLHKITHMSFNKYWSYNISYLKYLGENFGKQALSDQWSNHIPYLNN